MEVSGLSTKLYHSSPKSHLLWARLEVCGKSLDKSAGKKLNNTDKKNLQIIALADW